MTDRQIPFDSRYHACTKHHEGKHLRQNERKKFKESKLYMHATVENKKTDWDEIFTVTQYWANLEMTIF